MQDLGRKREQQQAERASRPAASTGASAGSASALQYEDSGLTRAERSSWRKRTVRARESPDDSGEEFGEYSDSDKNQTERSAVGMESDVRMVEEGPSAEITDVERIRVGRNRLEQVINSRKSHSPCSAHLFVFVARRTRQHRPPPFDPPSPPWSPPRASIARRPPPPPPPARARAICLAPPPSPCGLAVAFRALLRAHDPWLPRAHRHRGGARRRRIRQG